MNDLRPRLRAALLVLAAPLAALALAAPASAALTAPAATAAGSGVDAVTWNWALAPGATAYRVISATGTSLSGRLSAQTTSFTLTEMSTDTAAAAYVEAYDASPADTVDSSTQTAHSLAATPSGTMLLGSNYNQVALSWLANGNPAGTTYQVQWWVGTSTSVVFSTVSVAGTSVTATLSDLPGAQTVSLEVRALNLDAAPTPWDVVVSTFVGAINNQSAISSGTYALGVSSIAWSWSASTGAVQYQLFSDTGGAVSPVLSYSSATQPAQISYTQTGLLPNVAYTDYVRSFDGTTSTNSAAFTRYTLAAQTTGLALLSLNPAAATELLSWGANGNSTGTVYNVSWWTPRTSTISFSSATSSALATGLYAGASIYFTVQAQNGEGILAPYDASLTSAPVYISTYFPVGQQVVPGGQSGALTFVLPNEVVTVQLSTLAFAAPVVLQVSTPATPPPAPDPGLTALNPPVAVQITAFDDTTGTPGAPLQPRIPILIGMSYVASSLGAVNPQSLTLARYDSSRGAWVTLATSKNGSTLWGLTDHLSPFQLFGATPPSDLSRITVGPNPLRPIENPGAIMTFRNLPAGARVRIFDYVGERLADLAVDASGVASWDGRNGAGRYVASGVYLALIEGGGAKKTLRVAIER